MDSIVTFPEDNISFVVFLPLDDSIAIYKKAIKYEKLLCFRLLSAQLSQYSFSEKNSSRYG
jgi:hypothetical protein